MAFPAGQLACLYFPVTDLKPRPMTGQTMETYFIGHFSLAFFISTSCYPLSTLNYPQLAFSFTLIPLFTSWIFFSLLLGQLCFPACSFPRWFCSSLCTTNSIHSPTITSLPFSPIQSPTSSPISHTGSVWFTHSCAVVLCFM